MRIAIGIALAGVVATMPACVGDPPPCEAEFGPWGEMPNLDMLVGDTVETSLADHFFPTDCLQGFIADLGDSLFAAGSADPAVAVSVSRAVLTTVAIEEAEAVRVTVTVSEDAIMGPDPTAFHDFYVSVTAPR